MKKTNPLKHSFRLAIIIILAVVIYAYGFQVTQMGFEEIYSPTRQQSLTRVIRALFHPDIVEFDQVQVLVETPYYTPCPAGGVAVTEPDLGEPYLLATPSCAEPRSVITVEGFNLQSNYRGQLYFIPPSGVSLGLAAYETDDEGDFSVKAKLPPRPDDQAQIIRTIISNNVGKPRLSKTAIDTWGKIIETVFLALLATTFGIIFAVPVSFMAARNIMKDIKLPMNGLSLTLLGWPIGMWIGGTVASFLGGQSVRFTENPMIALSWRRGDYPGDLANCTMGASSGRRKRTRIMAAYRTHGKYRHCCSDGDHGIVSACQSGDRFWGKTSPGAWICWHDGLLCGEFGCYPQPADCSGCRFNWRAEL